MIHKLRQLVVVSSYARRWLAPVPGWLLRSGEFTNFTYEYTEVGHEASIEFAATVAGVPRAIVQACAEELRDDGELRKRMRDRLRSGGLGRAVDPRACYGRRAVWYLLVRALRPGLIVEAGTDKGMGACLMARALQRNAVDGHGGRLETVDHAPGSGGLIGPEFADLVTPHVADTIEFVQRRADPIDLFVHETVPLPDFERRQFAVLAPRLSRQAIVVSPWLTMTILEFARATDRRLLVFPEQPRDHWYPGSILCAAVPSQRVEADA